jgi:hypothetical protein
MVVLPGFNDARLDADLISILGLRDSLKAAKATADVQRGAPAFHRVRRSQKASATIAASLGVALITSVAHLLGRGSTINVGEKPRPDATFAVRTASVRYPNNNSATHIANIPPKDPFDANFHRVRPTPKLVPEAETYAPSGRRHGRTIDLEPREVLPLGSPLAASSSRADPVLTGALPSFSSKGLAPISPKTDETTHVDAPPTIASPLSSDATSLSRHARQDSVAAIRLLRRQW